MKPEPQRLRLPGDDQLNIQPATLFYLGIGVGVIATLLTLAALTLL